jgi:zinc transport system substrate-binding protein
VTHSHGPEGEHAHGAIDFNTWLDPEQAMMQAEAIAEAAGQLLPDDKDEFQANLATLKADLESLADSLRQIMSGYQNQPLLASHPVYNYLARFGGWNLKSVHFEPDEMPDDEQWAALDALLAEHPARWMIWEAEAMDEIVEKLKERKIGCVIFNPCGNTPASGDYLETMRGNIANLKPVFDNP